MAAYTGVFANNCSTTLASPITSATQTTISLTSAANLPTIPTGGIFVLTLNDAATQTVFEILYVTAISGTSLTVERGQDGTTATTWLAGDYAFASVTRGILNNFAQLGNTPNFAYGLSTTALTVTGNIASQGITGTTISGTSLSLSGTAAAGNFQGGGGGYAAPVYLSNGTNLGVTTHSVVGVTTLTFTSSATATQTIALSGAAQFTSICITYVSTNVNYSGLEISVSGSNTTPVTSITISGSFPSVQTSATIGVAYLAIGN